MYFCMSDSPKAVFLSYASEDVEAAKSIAESLRASGVEVWFNQGGWRVGTLDPSAGHT